MTDQEIISAAQAKRARSRAINIMNRVGRDTWSVGFADQENGCLSYVDVTGEEIATTSMANFVALDSKQEHVHNWMACGDCMKMNVAGRADHKHYVESCGECKALGNRHYVSGIEAGKASLKPWGVKALANFIAEKRCLTPSQELAERIADHFAAPERKPITVTPEQTEAIFDRYYKNDYESNIKDLREAIEHVLNQGAA